MDNTERLGLPLVQPAQAQKHVTVNEALLRLDALVELRLNSRSLAVPPGSAVEGACFAVSDGASDPWAGQGGKIAVFVNGGWDFIVPGIGWRAWIEDEGATAFFDGSEWKLGDGAISQNGAALTHRVIEIDHSVGAGVTSETVPVIPSHGVVFGVTARVTDALSGGVGSWRLGVAGADDRYGTGYGATFDAWARGVTSSPIAYYSDTPLLVTAENGAFSGGTVRLSVHVAEMSPPRT
ncbi:MAG: DUF2793 domain-containing protein [Pseudomonadota bacterium]